MKLLCLSTAEQGCSLAIVDNNNLLCEELWINKLTHSKRILKMIDHMLEKRACIGLDDIDGFVVAKGPGSFTGLRIGISVVQGMGKALDKPAVGVSSLDGIAFRFQHCTIPICVMMDARRDEVYCAVYQFDHGRLVSKSDEIVTNPEKIIETISTRTLFAGSGSRAYENIIRQKSLDPIIAHDFQNHVSAVAMIQSLCLKKNCFNYTDAIVIPSYIRQSDAQMRLNA